MMYFIYFSISLDNQNRPKFEHTQKQRYNGVKVVLMSQSKDIFIKTFFTKINIQQNIIMCNNRVHII